MQFKKIRPQEPISLRNFHQNKDKVAIIRKLGGLGDILMHRMIFEDFKRLMPGMHLTFACPKEFHDAVKDHPFLDDIIDHQKVNTKNYAISYDTTTPCLRYEMGHFPDKVTKHRADIWAEHCGVLCIRHNMHLNLDPHYKNQALNVLPPKNVLFTPISYDVNRTLPKKLIIDTVKIIRELGYNPYSMHTKPIPILSDLNVPVFTDLNILSWFGMIEAADYVVTVDTSVFHAAGGLKKPMTGIFTFADGLVRGQYYDFALVQKHRINGDWDCGPCFNHANCTKTKELLKPCLTEITTEMVKEGIEKMLARHK